MKLYRFLAFILRPLVWLLYPTKIIGKERIPKGKAVFASNHYSHIDVAIFATALFRKGINFLAKKELFEKKRKAKFFSRMGGIPVDRGNIDVKAMRKVIDVLDSGKQIVIFPEGTRRKDGAEEMLPFKSGSALFALKTKTQIVPITILKKPKIFRRNYLYIGEPFELTDYYGTKDFDGATQYLRTKMIENRQALYDEFPKSKKLIAKGKK